MWTSKLDDFSREITPFLDACPPGLAGRVVRRAADQPVTGVTSRPPGGGVERAVDSRNGERQQLSEGDELQAPVWLCDLHC